jgi:hypothetical protein
MDGVLRELNLAIIHICEKIGDNSAFEVDALTNTKPLLNPMLLALPEDELFCLTRCYTQKDIDRKQAWLNHFYGNRIKLLTVGKCTSNWGDEYCEFVGKAKFDILVNVGADIYMDDDPGLIRVMRRLNNEAKLNIKMIKYGPWIEHYVPQEKL